MHAVNMTMTEQEQEKGVPMGMGTTMEQVQEKGVPKGMVHHG